MGLRIRKPAGETAASETIGSVMLISVVVLAVAIIGVALTSQPAPTKIPAVSAVISESGNTVQIYHDGGDRLERSEIAIQVDGADKTSGFTDSSGSTGWTSWSVGQTLTYVAASGTPKAVQIIYKTGSGGASVLAATDFSLGTPRPTASPTPTPGPSTITATADSGVTISPSGAVSVVYGASQSFTITPNTGYSITDVKIDGVSQGAITGYTFTNVVAAHTIAVSSTANTYTITASAGTGGTISPSGLVNVTYGNSQIFTITANTGYNITNVAVDGTALGPISSYTFTSVAAAHTIAATFAQKTYVLTSSSGTGGTISPSGNTTVVYGGSQTYTITNASGYNVSSVTVDGVSQGAIFSYTFTNVQANHTISAAFAVNPTITASAGSNGAISPSGSVIVSYGGNQAFTIIPNSGYHGIVTVDGISQGLISSYTFTNVNSSHTISANFVANPTITSITGNTTGARGTNVINVRINGANYITSPVPTVIFSQGTNTMTGTVTTVTTTRVTVAISIPSSQATGAYSVTVTNTDGGTATYTSAFTVT